MIDPASKLTVFHDDNASFVNHTEAAADFIRDTFDIELIAAEDYLYLGFFKPFSAAYFKFITANVNANTMAMEYWDGSAWTSKFVTDETLGFTRSGFMFWDRAGMESTTVNSVTGYYVRFKPSADHSATTLRGINLVFADDAALKNEFFEIDNSNLLPPGETDHIAHHVAARNTIVQSLRNLQYIKLDYTGTYVNITQWDLFDMFEIRQAAVMLTLSKIFFILSDSQEDTWWAKYREYQDKYEEAFKIARLSLDSNDDGVKDPNENQVKFKVQRWQR